MVAATLTSVVSLPNVAMVRATASCRARLVRHIDRERLRTAAAVGDSARHGFRFGRIDIGDGDLGPLRREASGDRAADLAAAAGDQCHALRQPVRRRHQLVACCTKLPSKMAALGGYGFLMKPISASPSAIFS